MAVEIIEHLENPRKFIRECLKIIKSGGNLLITTPNVENPVSKALFVREGSLMWFNDRNYHVEGHITPLMQWQLANIIHESRLSIKSLTAFGNPYESVRNSWKKIYVLAKVIEKIIQKKDSLNGEILVAVLTLPNFL